MGKKAIVNEILYDSGIPENFHKLDELHRKDPYKARVLFLSKSIMVGKQIRLHKFIYDNGDIEFATYTKRWGISINNIMYSYSKKESMISYKKETNRFFAKKNNKNLYEPNYFTLIEILLDKIPSNSSASLLLVENFLDEFSYLKFIPEKRNEFSAISSISFNTIIRNRLFSYKDLIRFHTKFPYPVFEFFLKLRNNTTDYLIYDFFQKDFHKKYGKFVKNIENIQDDWLDEKVVKKELGAGLITFWNIVIDTIKNSRILNKKFNFSWSIKRVKQEHDNLYKEVIHISSEIDNRPIKVGDVFLKFEEYSGFKLIKHTSELRFEGIKNNNCVYTRLNNIESGNSAIFSIDGHTCQIHNWNGLYIQEISKYSNTLADSSVVASINEKIKSFNIEVLKIDPTKLVSPGVYTQEGDHAIFDAPPDFQRFEYNDLPF